MVSDPGGGGHSNVGLGRAGEARGRQSTDRHSPLSARSTGDLLDNCNSLPGRVPEQHEHARVLDELFREQTDPPRPPPMRFEYEVRESSRNSAGRTSTARSFRSAFANGCAELNSASVSNYVHETVNFGIISGLGNNCAAEVLSRSSGYSFGFDQFRCTCPS